MKPTFRKQYGSTRERDRLLIYQHVSAEGDLHTIADRTMSWRNGIFGVWQDGETERERREYLESEQRFIDRIVLQPRPNVEQIRAWGEAFERDCIRGLEPLPQHEATPEQMRECWSEQITQTRRAVVFDRKSNYPNVIQGLAPLSQRHWQWLVDMANTRPDAFALKQKLAKAV